MGFSFSRRKTRRIFNRKILTRRNFCSTPTHKQHPRLTHPRLFEVYKENFQPHSSWDVLGTLWRCFLLSLWLLQEWEGVWEGMGRGLGTLHHPKVLLSQPGPFGTSVLAVPDLCPSQGLWHIKMFSDPDSSAFAFDSRSQGMDNLIYIRYYKSKQQQIKWIWRPRLKAPSTREVPVM